jgi:3-oxoacyl-[acyl-carrier protein] reductase
MMNDATGLLAGRVALITGSSRGLGAAAARRFAACGARVAVNYVHQRPAAEGVVRAIREAGGQALAVQADVRDRQQVERLLEVVSADLGAPDTLVLNADPGGFRPTPLIELHAGDFETRLRDELQAAVVPVGVVLPGMLERRRGCILAVSSALCRVPVPAFSLLAVSKAALEAYVRALAVEVGPLGVRANTVEASMIEGDASAAVVPDAARRALLERIPLRRTGRPEDVAGVLALVASDLAGFVNGATVLVNGGQVLN